MKKRILDIAMILMLPLLMAYSLIGETFHEVLGVLMIFCFILHHIFNRWFYKTLFKGKFSPSKILTLVIDTLLLADILLLAWSGLVLSTVVFPFDFDSLYREARLVHLCAAYWGLILMSFHAGMHLKISKGKSKKIFLPLMLIVSILGIYFFIQSGIFDYLFLQTHFVFLDFENPVIFSILKTFCITILFATLGMSANRLVRRF